MPRPSRTDPHAHSVPMAHASATSRAVPLVSARQYAGMGLDGCRAGWVVATVCTSLHAGPTLDLQIRSQASLAQTLCCASASNPVLIDMPIGLPTNTPRAVDTLLRRALGTRRASVFDVPARTTLAATSHAEACDMQAGEIGRRLSIQSWHLVPRIRQLDSLLRQRVPGADHVHESHPEWLFRLLARDAEVAPKKSATGRTQRLSLLAQAATSAGLDAVQVLEAIAALQHGTRRADVQPDDLADAVVLALAACELARNGSVTLPPLPPRDACGLPMAVVAPRSWLRISPGL